MIGYVVFKYPIIYQKYAYFIVWLFIWEMQIWHKKWLFQSEKPQNDDDKSWQIHDSQCIIRFFDSIDNPLDTENAAFKEKKKKVLFRETQEESFLSSDNYRLDTAWYYYI